MVLAVRPEDLAIVAPDEGDADVVATVDRLEPLGNELLVHVRLGGEVEWVVRARADWTGQVDDRVRLHLSRDRLHLFDADSGARL